MLITLTLGFLTRFMKPFSKFSYYIKDIENLGMAKRAFNRVIGINNKIIDVRNKIISNFNEESIDYIYQEANHENYFNPIKINLDLNRKPLLLLSLNITTFNEEKSKKIYETLEKVSKKDFDMITNTSRERALCEIRFSNYGLTNERKSFNGNLDTPDLLLEVKVEESKNLTGYRLDFG